MLALLDFIAAAIKSRGMVSRAILLLVGLLILAFTTVQSSASTISVPRDAAPASTGAFDKISGTIKGTYHLGFNDYVQNYDAVTTANLVWEEDPNFSRRLPLPYLLPYRQHKTGVIGTRSSPRALTARILT